MGEVIEMGKISARGQIAIPADVRREMGLHEGDKVLFVVDDNTLLMRKVTAQSFAEITKPLKEAAKKVGIKEADVPRIVQRFRRKKRKCA
jgi:antitoxin PrlF